MIFQLNPLAENGISQVEQKIIASGGGSTSTSTGGVTSIAKEGETALTGAVTLSEGTGVILTQSGQDIEISATGGGGGSGTVTSIAVSGSDGIEVDSGSPVTTSGTIALGVNASDLRTHINVEDGAEANNISDVNATDLTDAGDSTLHYHATDRARANHTGTQTASTISDFDTEVSNNTDVAANTTARHSHSNKALLDTYTQTEADIADAISKEHSHANKATLDAVTAAFTTADETKLDGIEAGAEVNPTVYDKKGRRFQIHNPYSNGGANQYQGQLHAHSDESPDGIDTPTALATAYRDAGYDFLAITDHDTVTAPPAVSGITIIDSSIEEFYNGSSGHLIAIGTSVNSANETLQDVIDDHKNDGGMVMICHPNLTTLGTPFMEALTLERYNFMEIYNTFADDVDVDNAEDKWDEILSYGKKVFGTAVDDCHDVNDAAKFNDGWVQAFADTNTEANILQALERGNFYASIGASITSISLSGLDITVTVPDSSNIEFIGKRGRVLQTNNATTSAVYTILGDEMYVRVRVTKVSDSTKAWSQPIFLDYMDNEELTGQLAMAGGNGLYDNLLTNGNFDVAQRGTSFTGSSGYGLDRWFISHNASSATTSQQSSKDEYGNFCARLTLTTKGGSFTDYSLLQPLESQDCTILRGKTVVFSALVRRNSTFNAGAIELNIYQGTGTDETTVSTGRKNTSKVIAATDIPDGQWKRVWVRAYIETNKTQVGVVIRFEKDSTAAPDGSYFEIKQAQLHIGSYPRQYNPRRLSEEELLCYRYYYRVSGGSPSGMTHRTVPSSVATANTIVWQHPIPVPFRTPVVGGLGGTRGTDWRMRSDSNVTNSTGSVQTNDNLATHIGTIRFQSGTYTAGLTYHLELMTTSGYIAWDAEL